MPRNSSGTYSATAGNPVVTQTTITSTWANLLVADLGNEITASLDRSGKGGMLAALKLFDGTVASPGLTFSTETGTGIFRPSAGALNIGVGAASVASFTTALIDLLTAVSVNGTVTADGFVGPLTGNVTGNVIGDITGDVITGSLNNGQLAGTRNKIINGKMDISQRGTTFAAAANTYTLDRWAIRQLSSAAVVTIAHEVDVPINEFQYSLRTTCTTADVTVSAAENVYLDQSIEGFNARDLIGRTFTLSFWVRSSKTGVHCVAFRNAAADRAYIAEYTVNLANNWELKTVTVTGGLIAAGTWNWTGGRGLQVVFPLAVGSNFHTAANAWQTGDFLSTANQVNCLDTVNNIFAITGVQLEVGSVATPFEHRHYGQEFALCQRYFQALPLLNIIGYQSAAANLGTTIYLPTQMRATPTAVASTVSFSNGSNLTINPAAHLIRPQFTATNAGVAQVTADLTLSAEL